MITTSPPSGPSAAVKNLPATSGISMVSKYDGSTSRM